MACSCPIGARPDVADVDAALRLVGEEGAESLSAIARRLELAKATLSRHRSTCLGLGSAPAVPPPPGGVAGPGTAAAPEEREPADPAARQNKADGAQGAGRASETASGNAGTTRSPFAGLANPKDDALTAPRKLVAAEVERKCLQLRVRGWTYAAIAEQVGVTEDTALDTVERVLLRTRNRADSLAEGARALELARVDAIIASYWERATDPAMSRSQVPVGEDGTVETYDPSQDKAGAVLLKAMERRAKLLGLDSHNVNLNVVQLPGVQRLIRAVAGALEAEDPRVKARVIARMRAALTDGGVGSAPPMLGAHGAPLVIEVRPEPPAEGGPSA